MSLHYDALSVHSATLSKFQCLVCLFSSNPVSLEASQDMPESSSGSSSLSHHITACMTQLLLLSIGMYEDLKEYLNWYDTRRDTKFAADAPVVGLVLQRSHLVTGDEGHYSGVVSELEAQGAKVLPHFCPPSTLLV